MLARCGLMAGIGVVLAGCDGFTCCFQGPGKGPKTAGPATVDVADPQAAKPDDDAPDAELRLAWKLADGRGVLLVATQETYAKADARCTEAGKAVVAVPGAEGALTDGQSVLKAAGERLKDLHVWTWTTVNDKPVSDDPSAEIVTLRALEPASRQPAAATKTAGALCVELKSAP